MAIAAGQSAHGHEAQADGQVDARTQQQDQHHRTPGNPVDRDDQLSHIVSRASGLMPRIS
jgi:hypothetical protein